MCCAQEASIHFFSLSPPSAPFPSHPLQAGLSEPADEFVEEGREGGGREERI